MRRMGFVVITWVMVSLFSVSAAQNADLGAPYIQYYSPAAGGFVIERADGSDSRLFAEDDMRDYLSLVQPGWSPSGEWFSWNSGQGSAKRVDGGDVFNAVETYRPQIEYAVRLAWSPGKRNLLFMMGARTWRLKRDDDTTFILRDMDSGKSLAMWSINNVPSFYNFSEFEWSLDGDQVNVIALLDSRSETFQAIRVTLASDGMIRQQPVDEATWKACCGPRGVPPGDYYEYGGAVASPSGRYQATEGMDTQLLDRKTGQKIHIPPHSGATVNVKSLNFNADETWILVGQSAWTAGDDMTPSLQGVMNISGTYWRELTTCVDCVTWLPEQVDVGRLPLGSTDSVLLAPTATIFENKPVFGWEHANYEMVCDESYSGGRRLIPITGEGESYILNYQRPCETEQSQDVLAAVSPDGKILALSPDNQSIVSIWSTHAGDLLTRLNTFGYGLSFSAGGHELYTRTTRAIHTWDVDEIWRRYSYRAGLD